MVDDSSNNPPLPNTPPFDLFRVEGGVLQTWFKLCAKLSMGEEFAGREKLGLAPKVLCRAFGVLCEGSSAGVLLCKKVPQDPLLAEPQMRDRKAHKLPQHKLFDPHPKPHSWDSP